jgi:REP element-mobilizing transposase RayT
MGRSRYKVFEEYLPYFMTSSIVGFYPLFNEEKYCRIILDGLDFLIAHREIKIYAYVLMPNHIHLIAEGEELAKRISGFKSFTARQIIDLLKEGNETEKLECFFKNKRIHKKDRKYQVWTEGFHPKQIRNADMMIQKIGYIHYNPVKAGLVEQSHMWKYSSAGMYEGEKSELDISIFEG